MKKITQWTLIISIFIMICWIILLSLNENIKRTDPFHYHEIKQILLKNRLINHVHIPPNSSVYYWVYALHTAPIPVNQVLSGKEVSWLDLSQPIKWGNYQIKSIGYYDKRNHLAHELYGVGIEALRGRVPNPKWFKCPLKNNILFFQPKYAHDDWRAQANTFSGCLNAQKVQFLMNKQKIELNNVGILTIQNQEKWQNGAWILQYPNQDHSLFYDLIMVLDKQRRLIYARGRLNQDGLKLGDCVYHRPAYFETRLAENQRVVWQWELVEPPSCQHTTPSPEQWQKILKQQNG